VGLVSLGVGVALGAALGTLAAMLHVAGMKRLVIGAIALAFVTIFAQHAWLYREFRRQWQHARAQSPQATIFLSKEFDSESPLSPRKYLAHEATPGRVAFWCLDAGLIAAAAAGTIWILERKRSESDKSADTKSPNP